MSSPIVDPTQQALQQILAQLAVIQSKIDSAAAAISAEDKQTVAQDINAKIITAITTHLKIPFVSQELETELLDAVLSGIESVLKLI